jgi:LPXTG-site transpeptidase (sortase) family protein
VQQRSVFDVTPVRVAVAVIAMAMSLGLLAFILLPADDSAPSVQATPAPQSTELAAATPSTAPTETTTPATGDAETPTSGSATATPDATQAPVVTSTPIAATSTTPPKPLPGPDVRLQIPSIGVDAWVIRMGLDANGVMEVPRDGQLVAWYDFTSVPGAPGNAVMSAHLDYRGSTAVFWRLDDLQDGDRVTVLIEGESIEYVVSTVYLTRPEEADLREILGGRSGPETLTLITCGGVWDAAEGEYDHRVIVQATRIV